MSDFKKQIGTKIVNNRKIDQRANQSNEIKTMSEVRGLAVLAGLASVSVALKETYYCRMKSQFRNLQWITELLKAVQFSVQTKDI